LGKFVLRAKVKIIEESGEWRMAGLVAPYVVGTGANGSGGNASPSGGPGAGQNLGGGAGDEPNASTASGAAGPGDESAPELEARAASWAAAQFEAARARTEAAGEQTFAAAQLEDAESVVELPTASALMLPDEVNAQSRSDSTVIVRVGTAPPRWLVISPAGEKPPLSGCKPAGREAWRLLDIAEGIPQVYAATSEEFVAQMLNLDVLGGVSFEKGCYTGQEVIARAHYRGRVKRRMQRFMSRGPAKLAIGESGLLADGRAFKVVEAAQLANGRCEFLAVAPMVAGGAGAADEDAPSGAVAGASALASGIDAEPLPLPYALPE